MSTGTLTKLTVAQLKALCKEKGLTGYSKLAKGVLIEKLLDHENANDGPVGDMSAVVSASAKKTLDEEKEKRGKPKSHDNESHNTAADTNLVTATSNAVNQKEALENRTEQAADNAAHICGRNDWDGNAGRDKDLQSWRGPEGEPLRKKRKLDISNAAENKEQGYNKTDSTEGDNVAQTDKRVQPISMVQVTGKEGANSSKPSSMVATQLRFLAAALDQQKAETSISGGKLGPSKKYIPLVVKTRSKKVQLAQLTSTPIPYVEEHHGTSPSQVHPLTPSERLFPDNAEIKYYLDFPLLPETSPEFLSNHCHPILLPPSLHHRSLLHSLTIFLRDITFEDFRNISLTGRVWRYAAHMSAEVYLRRWFPGKRVEDVIEKVKRLERDKVMGQGRMSLWKYRVAREEEYRERRCRFERSFLGRILEGGKVIADMVWRSGESGREAVVAVRFLLTRYWFCISLGLEVGEMAKWRVIDVREVVRGEIWCITTVKTGGWSQTVHYYVLEATCEIVGTPVATERARSPVQNENLPIRADWSTYIQKRSNGAEDMGPSILDSVRWTNHEEYEKGTSKLWLMRIMGEKEAGEAKKVVCDRYVIACAMGNSLSGRYMTASEMEQELNGLPTRLELGKGGYQRIKGGSVRVNLFLHAHHHVESVHFTTAAGKPLHPALAVVQTPGREYYVLRDNGMVVGCEEEGVSEVWMEVIGCSAIGELV